jgi:membrane-associated protease RseP (regulator of RpoE activity)
VKRKALLSITALALLSVPAAARAQGTTPAPAAQAAPSTQAAPPAQAPAPPVAFATTFVDDGNFLGVHVEELTRENMKSYGVTGEPRGVGISRIVKGSPAERAGLRERDVIVRFDGEPVTSVRKLNRLIDESSPEHAARLTVLRGGSEQEVSATLARREQFAPAVEAGLMPGADSAEAQRFAEEWARNQSEDWERKGGEQLKRLEELQRNGNGLFTLGSSRRIGVSTSPLGPQLAGYFGVSHGVLVNSVEANSPAEKAGLRAGDVLTEADGRQIDDASDLVRALGGKDEGEVTLTLVRDKKQRTLRVKPERRRPQSYLMNPGAMSLGVAPPVVSVAPRIMAIPHALRLPQVQATPYVLSAPRVIRAPRTLVSPPRVTVFGFGDRVL